MGTDHPPSTSYDNPPDTPLRMEYQRKPNKKNTQVQFTDPFHVDPGTQSVGSGVPKDHGPHQSAPPQDSPPVSIQAPHLGGTLSGGTGPLADSVSTTTGDSGSEPVLIDEYGNEASPYSGSDETMDCPSAPDITQGQDVAKGDVMDADWTSFYEVCPQWGTIWNQCQDPSFDQWPPGVKLLGQTPHQRLFVEERLAVPKALCLRVIAASHAAWGHVGQRRTLHELRNNFAFGSRWNITAMVKYVVTGCHVCQATEPPNWRLKGQFDYTPVIDQPMVSVCMDILSMPRENWQASAYDSILLCVDQFTGWIIALPALKEGLKAEKDTHMIIERWWDGFGIPSIITCDRGPNLWANGGRPCVHV